MEKKEKKNLLHKFSSVLLKYRIIKQNEFFKANRNQIIKDNEIYKKDKQNTKIKKYQLKDQENADIWSVSENFNRLSQNNSVGDTDAVKGNQKNYAEGVPLGKKDKPNLKEDIFKEMLGFKLKRLNKAGARTPKELWERLRFLSKGLTLDEWSDRVESSWENRLEYSEKLWENFFIFSFKKYNWYPYTQKLWSDSWYGQNWRNWRREEDTVTWQINSRIPWNKHVRLSNDASMLFPNITRQNTLKNSRKDYTFPQDAEKIIGPNRLKLKNQIFTNNSRHEIIKQGVYNTEQAEVSAMNAWQDSANIYLKYIRPWLFRLNFLDKPGHNAFKYLGKEQHRKNYQVVSQKIIFQSELYKISYNLKLIKQLSEIELNQKNLGINGLERKFGKRNVKMFIQNKDKFLKLLRYEKLLHFRQMNQNLLKASSNAINPLAVLPPASLNKHIRLIFFVILYYKK